MTTLVELPCTAGECTYKTPALPYEYAFQQMVAHRSDVHTTATTASVTPNQTSKQKAPELGRPKIAREPPRKPGIRLLRDGQCGSVERT